MVHPYNGILYYWKWLSAVKNQPQMNLKYVRVNKVSEESLTFHLDQDLKWAIINYILFMDIYIYGVKIILKNNKPKM